MIELEGDGDPPIRLRSKTDVVLLGDDENGHNLYIGLGSGMDWWEEEIEEDHINRMYWLREEGEHEENPASIPLIVGCYADGEDEDDRVMLAHELYMLAAMAAEAEEYDPEASADNVSALVNAMPIKVLVPFAAIEYPPMMFAYSSALGWMPAIAEGA